MLCDASPGLLGGEVWQRCPSAPHSGQEERAGGPHLKVEAAPADHWHAAAGQRRKNTAVGDLPARLGLNRQPM